MFEARLSVARKASYRGLIASEARPFVSLYSLQCWRWALGLACFGVVFCRSSPGQAAEPASAAPSSAPATTEVAPSPTPKPLEQASRRAPPTGWYVGEFVTGVSFATMQVALVWAIVDHDEPKKRDRLLIISGVAAVTALAALGTAALVLASDNGKPPRATAYVGFGSVGLSASF
jgi:hypothetical protein